MRAGPRSPVLLLLAMGCTALAAAAQATAPQLSVTVIVVNANSQPPQPVKAARVSLTHLISTQVAVDAQGPTNPRGEAQLVLSQSAAKNGDLRIVISGVSNLVIYDPADGQTRSLKSPIRVVLLPTGSLALLGPAQIQAYLRRLLLQVNSLQKQVSALKTEAAQGQSQQQYLSSALADFAQAMGFHHDQVNQQVAIWAQNIKLQSAQATTAEQRPWLRSRSRTTPRRPRTTNKPPTPPVSRSTDTKPQRLRTKKLARMKWMRRKMIFASSSTNASPLPALTS